jgi:beta-galactosidase
MRKITFFVAISLSFAAFGQSAYDLAPRGVEPSRARVVPYHRVADAIVGNATQSRYRYGIEEFAIASDSITTTYTASFPMGVSWLNRQLLLRVGYAESAFEVRVNDRAVGFVPCGAMGAEFNITKMAAEGRNKVEIILQKSHSANRIYATRSKGVKGVEVLCQPTLRVRDIEVKVNRNEAGEGVAEFALPVKCDALNRKSARLHYTLRQNDTIVVAEGYREISLDMRREDTVRFACVVPRQALWSGEKPTLLRLDIESRIENRVVEALSRKVGLREAKIEEGKLKVNGEVVNLNFAEVEALKSLDEAVKLGYNGVIITLDRDAERVIEECAKRGLYVVVRAPIDTTLLGDDIKRGGNPSNDPMWNQSYLWRNTHALNSVKGSCAVIGYAIGKGKTSGLNIYDTYLLLKSLQPNHLVIYEGAKGEWATDK